MNTSRLCLTLASWLLLVTWSRAGVVWLEGESPARSTVAFASAGWGSKQYLSGEKWLFANLSPAEVEKKVPQSGASLEYDFTLAKPGKYEVWARIGYEFVRAPF